MKERSGGGEFKDDIVRTLVNATITHTQDNNKK
jgi:hypothetical protein